MIDRSDAGLELVKQKLVEAYQNDLNKPLFDEGFKKKTFNELLTYVSINKDKFITLCKTKNT